MKCENLGQASTQKKQKKQALSQDNDSIKNVWSGFLKLNEGWGTRCDVTCNNRSAKLLH
jgi:hypothetical protein